MSTLDEQTNRVSARTRERIARSHSLCEDSEDCVAASQQAVDRSRKLLAEPFYTSIAGTIREPEAPTIPQIGWMRGAAHPHDLRAELRQAIDRHRKAEGMKPLKWERPEERQRA